MAVEIFVLYYSQTLSNALKQHTLSYDTIAARTSLTEVGPMYIIFYRIFKCFLLARNRRQGEVFGAFSLVSLLLLVDLLLLFYLMHIDRPRNPSIVYGSVNAP